MYIFSRTTTIVIFIKRLASYCLAFLRRFVFGLSPAPGPSVFLPASRLWRPSELDPPAGECAGISRSESSLAFSAGRNTGTLCFYFCQACGLSYRGDSGSASVPSAKYRAGMNPLLLALAKCSAQQRTFQSRVVLPMAGLPQARLFGSLTRQIRFSPSGISGLLGLLRPGDGQRPLAFSFRVFSGTFQ